MRVEEGEGTAKDGGENEWIHKQRQKWQEVGRERKQRGMKHEKGRRTTSEKSKMSTIILTSLIKCQTHIV